MNTCPAESRYSISCFENSVVPGQDPLFSIRNWFCQNLAVCTDDFIFSSTMVNILVLIFCVWNCCLFVYTFYYILGFPNPLKKQIWGLVDLSKSKLRFCFNSNLFDLNYSSTHIDMHSWSTKGVTVWNFQILTKLAYNVRTMLQG